MPNERALKMLSTALEMEGEGRRFYRDTLKRCEHPAAREIYQMLMNDEVVHVEIIKRIYDAIVGGQDWTDDFRQLRREQESDDLAGFFEGLAKRLGPEKTSCQDDLAALEVGLDFERRAVAFYEDQLQHAQDPLEKKFVKLMIDEERTHVAVLTDMKVYLENPQSWFLEHGHPLLDGV